MERPSPLTLWLSRAQPRPSYLGGGRRDNLPNAKNDESISSTLAVLSSGCREDGKVSLVTVLSVSS